VGVQAVCTGRSSSPRGKSIRLMRGMVTPRASLICWRTGHFLPYLTSNPCRPIHTRHFSDCAIVIFVFSETPWLNLYSKAVRLTCPQSTFLCCETWETDFLQKARVWKWNLHSYNIKMAQIPRVLIFLGLSWARCEFRSVLASVCIEEHRSRVSDKKVPRIIFGSKRENQEE
jgi:hypothetical protein